MSRPAGAAGLPGASLPKDDDVPLLNNQAYEVAARHSCDPIFDEWIVCVMRSECYQAKDAQLRARGGQAGHAELKQCARKNAALVPEQCATLHEAVKLCNRSQVDMRKRFKGKQNVTGDVVK